MTKTWLLSAVVIVAACVDSATDVPLPDQGGKEDGHGATSPFDPASCTGTPLTLAELQQLTDNGTAPLPSGTTYLRSRACGSLGCGPWTVETVKPPTSSTLAYTPYHDDVVFDALYDLKTSDGSRTRYHWNGELTFTPSTQFISMVGSWTLSSNQGLYHDEDFDGMQATVTDHCFRAVGHLAPVWFGKQYPDREVVYLAKY